MIVRAQNKTARFSAMSVSLIATQIRYAKLPNRHVRASIVVRRSNDFRFA